MQSATSGDEDARDLFARVAGADKRSSILGEIGSRGRLARDVAWSARWDDETESRSIRWSTNPWVASFSFGFVSVSLFILRFFFEVGGAYVLGRLFVVYRRRREGKGKRKRPVTNPPRQYDPRTHNAVSLVPTQQSAAVPVQPTRTGKRRRNAYQKKRGNNRDQPRKKAQNEDGHSRPLKSHEVCPPPKTAHDDKPITYKKHKKNARVVEKDDWLQS